jgi:plastocyanin
MKLVAILGVIVVLLGGVYLYLSMSANDSELTPEPTAEVATVAEEVPEGEDHNMMEEIEEGTRAFPPNAAMEYPIPDDEAVLETKEFTVDAFNYGYDITEIRVKQGDRVTINLTNSGGFHDLVIDEFSAATEKIREGGLTSVTFVADKAGTFEFYCSVGNHRAEGMVGTLIVE